MNQSASKLLGIKKNESTPDVVNKTSSQANTLHDLRSKITRVSYLIDVSIHSPAPLTGGLYKMCSDGEVFTPCGKRGQYPSGSGPGSFSAEVSARQWCIPKLQR